MVFLPEKNDKGNRPSISGDMLSGFAPGLRRKDFVYLGQQRFDLCQRRREQFSGHIGFIGKIEPGFDQCRRLDDLFAPYQ